MASVIYRHLECKQGESENHSAPHVVSFLGEPQGLSTSWSLLIKKKREERVKVHHPGEGAGWGPGVGVPFPSPSQVYKSTVFPGNRLRRLCGKGGDQANQVHNQSWSLGHRLAFCPSGCTLESPWVQSDECEGWRRS